LDFSVQSCSILKSAAGLAAGAAEALPIAQARKRPIKNPLGVMVQPPFQMLSAVSASRP
jgi:hypothetical protein